MQNEQMCRCRGGDIVRIGESTTMRVVEIRGDMVILRLQSHKGERIDRLDKKEQENLEKAIRSIAESRRDSRR